MNARRNAKGNIIVGKHDNATEVMALRYYDIMITTLRNVDKGVISANDNELCPKQRIDPVPLV